jgi:MinD superfamily P-loop ATPase
MVCPHDAIEERAYPLGVVETGSARGMAFGQGTLNVGEAMATPIIRALAEEIDPRRTVILDAPPGTGCPAIAAIHGADIALLVTEPTPFGLHDLRAAVRVARVLDVPVGVILNRAGVGDDRIELYCEEEEIPLLMKIPFDREVAASYAIGTPLIDRLPEWTPRFRALGERLEGMVR